MSKDLHSNPSPNTRMRVIWFLVVGATAAMVHALIVLALVSVYQMPPLMANVLGWLAAFFVSFTGHYRLTFRDQAAPLARAARRFFAVSAIGFAINQSMYAFALSIGQRYDIALFFVLLMVAIITYFASRRWAFLRS